ncbi:MAG: VWA domain-containing protein, partial [Hyphomicrobium sp.]
ARWRITKSGAGAPVKSLEAPGIAEDLDPGSYDVEAEIDGLKAKGQVTVDAGKPATLALALNGGHLIVRAKSAKDAAPGRAPIVTISEAAKGERAARTVMLGRLDSVDTLLPPAVYTVAIVDGQIRQERQVAIAEGAEAVAEFTLATGSLALSAVIQEGGAPLADVTFSVLEDDPDSPDGRREVLRSRAPEPQFTLPAGTYYVSARAGNAETRQRIALSAGDSIKKSLVILAAPLKVSAIVAGAAPPESAGLVYRIFNLEGDPREVARGTAPDFNGLLNAGRYRLSATLENHGASASQDVVLEAGKPLTSVLEIDAGEISFKAPSGAGLAAAGDSFWEIRDSGGRAIWHATVAEPKVLLSPGRYTVRMEARDRGSEAAFEVVSGERRHIELGPNPPGTP